MKIRKRVMTKILPLLITFTVMTAYISWFPLGKDESAAATLNTNLIVNANGEAGGNGSDPVALNTHGWTGGDSDKWYAYTSDGSIIRPHGGSYFMAVLSTGQYFPTSKSCYQDIDISSLSSDIDNGYLIANLGGWMQRTGSVPDSEVKLQLQELDQYGNVISDVFEQDCSSYNVWEQAQLSESILPGTRIIRVTMVGNNITGETRNPSDWTDDRNYAAFDDLSLVMVRNTSYGPTITQIADQTIVAGDTIAPINFTIADPDTPVSGLQVTVSSSNQKLIPDANISKSLSGDNGTLNLTVASDQLGQTTITVTLSDGIRHATSSFIVTVNPDLQLGSNLVINGDGSSLYGWYGDTSSYKINSSQQFEVTKEGTYQYLNQDINISKFSALIDAGFVQFTSSYNAYPQPYLNDPHFEVRGLDQNGQVLWTKNSGTIAPNTRTIKITIYDFQGGKFDNINFKLLDSNYPKITNIPDQKIKAGLSANIPFTIGYTGDTINLTASSSNTGLIPNDKVTFGGSDYERTINIASLPDVLGSTVISIFANGSVMKTFNVNVSTVPGAPTGVTTTAGVGYADVSFNPPASDGMSPITEYIVTSSPGGITARGKSSPIRVSNLTNGIHYTFTVNAVNSNGTGSTSLPSQEVIPGISTSLNLTASPPSGIIYGTPLTLTAFVKEIAGANIPTGTVTFKNGSTILASGINLDDAGRAVYVWNNAPAGRLNISAEYNGDIDHLASVGDITYDIGKAEQADFSITGIPKIITYGDPPFSLSTVGGSGTGAVTYALVSGDAVNVDSNGAVTVIRAGTATITATKDGDNNYKSCSSSITITVNKAATSILIPPVAENIVLGSLLSTSSLLSGEGSVEGTFRWIAPDTIVLTPGSFEAIFEPADTNNYNSSIVTIVEVSGQPIKFDSKITINTNSFMTFLNHITFGLFFKNTADVTITGNVGEGGRIEYQKVAKISDYDPNGAWTTYTDTFGIPGDDKFIIVARLTDNSDNVTIINSDGIIVDKTCPEISLTSGVIGWSTSNVNVQVEASDSLAGIKKISYTTDEETPQEGTLTLVDGKGTINLINNGEYTLTACAEDNAGNIKESSLMIKIDKTTPTLDVVGNPTSPVQSANLTVDTVVGPSGGMVTVSKDGGIAETITGSSYTVSENGIYTFTVTNGAGVTASKVVTVNNIDNSKPVISINSNGYTSGDWTNSNVTLNVSNSNIENLGMTTLEYSLDGGVVWTVFNGTISISNDSINNYLFRAISESGVISDSADFTVNMDKSAPSDAEIRIEENSFKTFLHTITFGLFFKDTVDVSITGNFDISGCKKIEYQKVEEISYYDPSGAWTAYIDTFSVIPDDKFIIVARLTDNSGNITIISSDGIIVDKTSPNLSLTSSTTNWSASNIDINIEALDSLAGIKKISYTTDEETPQEGTLTLVDGKGTINLINNGEYTLTVCAEDNAGNIKESSLMIKIDKTTPALDVVGNPTSPVQSANLTVDTVVGPSGGMVTVSKDGGIAETITGSSYTVSENGIYTFTVTNGAGVTASKVVTVNNIDNSKPVISINSNGYTSGDWTNSNVTLNVSNSNIENLDMTTLEYSLDGGAVWTVFDGTIRISSNGINNYLFKAISKSGITSDYVRFQVKIDKSVPIIAGVENDGSYYINRTVTYDANYGIIDSAKANGSDFSSGTWFNVPKNYSIIVTDGAGNVTKMNFEIKSIPIAGNLTLDDRAIVSNIRAEYETQKLNLPTERANEIDLKIKSLEMRLEQLTNVRNITNLVNSIPENLDFGNVDSVISIARAYNTLSEDEKTDISKDTLKKMKTQQEQIAQILHTNGNVTISGVEWYIKLKVEPKISSDPKWQEISSKAQGKTVLELLECTLYDEMNNVVYEVPEGTTITTHIPAPDVTGYENVVVAHQNKDGTVEFITPEIKDGVITFTLSSFSPIAILAEKMSTETSSATYKELDNELYPSIVLFILMVGVSIGTVILINKKRKNK